MRAHAEQLIDDLRALAREPGWTREKSIDLVMEVLRGAWLRGRDSQDQRSTPQHNRLFKLFDVAFHHWPESFEEFQPESAEHLRAWLLCKAGHFRVTTVPFEFDDPRYRELAMIMLEQALKAAGANAFPRPNGNAIAVFAAKSINYKTVGHKAFQPIAMAVEEIIEGVIGIPTDDLLKHHERAA